MGLVVPLDLVRGSEMNQNVSKSDNIENSRFFTHKIMEIINF